MIKIRVGAGVYYPPHVALGFRSRRTRIFARHFVPPWISNCEREVWTSSELSSQKVKNAGRLPALRNQLGAYFNFNSAFALIASRRA